MMSLILNLVLLLLVLAQTTLVGYIAVLGIKPDLPLIALVYLAHKQGRLGGQTCGFLSGIALDMLSLTPLGFHAFCRTVLGFLFGSTAGKIYVDAVFLPMLLTAVATIAKIMLYAVLRLFFNIQALAGPLWAYGLLLELVYNVLLAPVVINGLNMLYQLFPRHWREFQS